MSIATKINQLITDISNAYDKVQAKGGTIPQYKNSNNLASVINSIQTGGGSSANFFIQDTQPSTYNGIWVADSNYSSYPVVEVAGTSSLVASSINIIKGTTYGTVLFSDSINIPYSFNNVLITDNNNNLIYNISIYYGNGSQWLNVKQNYTQIEYIESTGSQYIDAGIIAKPSTGIYADFQATNVSSNQYYFGTLETTSSTSGLSYNFYRNSSNQWAYCYNNGTGSFISTGVGCNTNRHTLNFNKDNDLALKMDNGSTINITLQGSPTDNSNVNFYIFARGHSAGGFSTGRMKLYSFKMYENKNLTRDFIPVKDSNNVACLYDKITNTFYYNQGTGTFTAGGEV